MAFVFSDNHSSSSRGSNHIRPDFRTKTESAFCEINHLGGGKNPFSAFSPLSSSSSSSKLLGLSVGAGAVGKMAPKYPGGSMDDLHLGAASTHRNFEKQGDREGLCGRPTQLLDGGLNQTSAAAGMTDTPLSARNFLVQSSGIQVSTLGPLEGLLTRLSRSSVLSKFAPLGNTNPNPIRIIHPRPSPHGAVGVHEDRMVPLAPVGLTVDNMNQNIRHAEYAVRGAVPLRASQIEGELKQGKKFNFSRVIHCNIGNPHALNQKPITYFRQVVSFVVNPELLKVDAVTNMCPKDVVDRANFIIQHTPGGSGAYSGSQGLEFVREDVAKFIATRDGHACKASSIFLTQGASPGIQMVLNMLIRSKNDAILIPTPQYPLYSGTIKALGGTSLPYMLDESKDWNLNIDDIKKSVITARKNGQNVRGLAVINPGNPTGSCLPENTIHELIDFCGKEKIVVLADEVYQTNVWQTAKPFISFRKALFDTKNTETELFSFHSVSKGYMGECGMRGGYYQMENIHDDIRAQFFKMSSLQLCPNVVGQVMVDMMVNPPKPGSPSYELYAQETGGILESLKRRAVSVTEGLNNIPGVHCQPLEGSMYAFPSLNIPPKAVQEAARLKTKPDLMYCLSLLEEEGLCCVPGSGFGQADGTYHLRTSILPPEEDIKDMIQRFHRHHVAFTNKWL